MEPGDCPFCRKLASLEALAAWEVVWHFPHSVALLGPWQFFAGYCILVSRRHATELSELEDAERRAYLEEMCVLARAVQLAFQPHKLNYELLGNQVPHLHWHLFPRAASDPDRFKPVWLALERAERDPGLHRDLEASDRDRAAMTGALRHQLHQLGAPLL